MCRVHFPAFPKVIFTHVSEGRSARLFASLRLELNGRKPDERFQGGESRFPLQPYLQLALFPGPNTSPLMWRMRGNLCNLRFSNHRDIYFLFPGIGARRPNWGSLSLLWGFNVMSCVKESVISFPGLDCRDGFIIKKKNQWNELLKNIWSHSRLYQVFLFPFNTISL